MSKCYMCDNDSTSDEHAPPKCLFPEQKDLPDGIDLRKDLITVRSCDEHNIAKSKDDEYLLNVLSISITNNQTGINQFLTKVRRAFLRNPAIIKGITQTNTPVTVKNSKNNTVENTVAAQIDRNRIELSLDKTARALYYYETKETFVGDIQIIPGFLLDMNDIELNQDSATLIKSIEGLTDNLDLKGKNPEAFSYKIHVDKEHGSIIEMNFYETTKAFAIMKHKK